MGEAVERARADLAAGRPWAARDRLSSALVERQDGEVVALLVEVHLLMGDLPRAGALLYAAGRDDAEAQPALEAWRHRYGNDLERWRSIPGPLRRHGATGPVAELARAAGVRPRADGTRAVAQTRTDRGKDVAVASGCAAVALVVLTLLGIGIWTVGYWLIG